MATNPYVVSMPVTAPPPPLSLREILLVHLVVFQEAVFSYHVHEFSIVKCLQSVLKTLFPVHLIAWNRESTPRLPDISRINTDRQYRASIMWMKCDTFCAIMQPFVDQHLDKLLGLSNPTIWTSFRAIPELLLLTEVQDFDEPPDHSVLMITDSHGEKYFFDGTIDQYGWDWRTHWLMTEKELMESHIDLSQVPWFQEEDLEDVKATRALAMGMDNEYGYWAIASRRMKQIFRQIDWDALRGCAEGEIEERIRLLSRASFAGAFEETMAQQDISL